MRANAAPQSVADYCNALNNKSIVVNEHYQRGDSIWSPVARSYFIESILLEYPIPKIYLYAKVDLQTRQSIKEIVDGQQRSRALQSFFNNKLRLSTKLETEEYRGKRYKDLDEVDQSRFLGYSLPIDEFQAVTEDEVQESFRRMNASNVPLNAEEQRNAKYQGEFKWHLISFAKDYRAIFSEIKLFSKRDVVRMQDLKAYAEVACVLDRGFITIKSTNIDGLYRKYNSVFDPEGDIATRLRTGIGQFAQQTEYHQKTLLRSHVFQSLVLAIIETVSPCGLSQLAADTAPDAVEAMDGAQFNIDELVSALDDPDNAGNLAPFVEACSQKTNVSIPRATRFLYFLNALTEG